MKNAVPTIGYLGLIILLTGFYLYVTDTATQSTSLITILIGLALLATFAVFDWETVKNLLDRRSTRYGANAAVMVLVLIGILTFVNLIGSRYSKRFDTTATQRFSLADLTVSVLEELKQGVHIVGFFRSTGAEAGLQHELNDMLNQYQYHSNHISYEFIDPDREPSLAKQYNITAYGTIVFESTGKTEHVTRINEETITNALVKVTREGQKTIYFLEGHGEHNINLTDQTGYNKIQQLLQNQSYITTSLSLLTESAVPEDCNVLIIAGSKKNLLAGEQVAVRNYLERGGRALIMVNPDFLTESADFSSLLASWKVKIGDNIVVDRSAVGRLPGMNEFMPAVMQYPPHAITRTLGGTVSFFPLVRSIEPAAASHDTLEIRIIAMTGPRSWAESAFPKTREAAEEMGDYTPELDSNNDEPGPIPIAVAITAAPRTLTRKDMTTLTPQEIALRPEEHELKTRIVVIGNSTFADNTNIGLPGNSDLMMNIVNWLAEEEDLLAIRPKSSDTRLIQISLSQMWDIFILTGVLAPIGILIIGVVVWWKRK